ncbi:MAG: CocE/NonD family hydrolase [Chloroflexi bacterium]|nr:CocE/NonD family hydrolase [Chloroflexota bacterium]
MLSKKWQTSPRQYDVVHERNVAIPVSAGFTLDCDIVRPNSPDRFPCIVGFFPFDKDNMLKSMMPVAVSGRNVSMESGDYNFYVRRGYAHVFVNVRGTGLSGGLFDHLGDGTTRDLYDAIEWLARQPWCDGQVATFGTSYFSMTAKRVAELKPPSLKTIFAPFGVTDQYRDAIFQGGIFAFVFHPFWLKSLSNLRVRKEYREKIGNAEFNRQIEQALQDPEINIHPELVQILQNPDAGGNMLIVEYLLNYLDTDLYKEKTVRFDVDVEIPGYFGGCWAMHSLHLPGDFRTFENWKGPKKLTIGPPLYLDRPVYQYHYESLRWFDFWLKRIDTGIMGEPPIQLFIQNTGEWKSAHEWPLPETQWTEFYLHENGLLSEHEILPHETASTFHDLPEDHGSLTFLTPPMVENTEVCGPMVLNLYASATDTEALWFVNFLQVDEAGNEKVLTRGWLRGSQRRIDPTKSRPWLPYHSHAAREPLIPGEVYEFNIAIVPTGVLFKPGYRFGIRIKCADKDDQATDFLDQHGLGHLWRETRSQVTVYHNNQYPSHLLVPITQGNRIGTFMSGGILK